MTMSGPEIRSRLRAGVALLAAAGFAIACAGLQPSHRAPALVSDPGGFTISESVRAGGSARASFEAALRALEQKQYESGIAEMTRVTEAARDATSAHINLAIAYRETNDLARAEESLKKALAINPLHPAALNELGVVYRRMGRFAEARKSYEQALAIYPKFHFARRNLAILCDLYLRDTPCALEQYELYLQAVPGDQQAATWVADLRARAGK
jgi:tetratricopeptide (TPR) repeat protein